MFYLLALALFLIVAGANWVAWAVEQLAVAGQFPIGRAVGEQYLRKRGDVAG